MNYYKYVKNGEILGYGNFIKTDCDSILLTNEELRERNLKRFLNDLRVQRDDECFSVINRGQLWYDRLTEEQKIELSKWYQEWLDVTETKTIPIKPSWLK